MRKTRLKQHLDRPVAQRGPLRASLTVECALALPAFFLAVVMLITLMYAVRFQLASDLELSDKARRLAFYASLEEGSGEDKGSGEEWIDLQETRIFKFPVSPVPSLKLPVIARARVRPWTGEDGSRGPSSGGGDDPMVYVTDNESVYHTLADCSHLDLHISAVPFDEVRFLRNAYGSRYRPCRGFPEDYRGTVYVTEKGNYYYPSLSYDSLTRHVRMIRRSEAGSLPLCSRCRERGYETADAA